MDEKNESDKTDSVSFKMSKKALIIAVLILLILILLILIFVQYRKNKNNSSVSPIPVPTVTISPSATSTTKRSVTPTPTSTSLQGQTIDTQAAETAAKGILEAMIQRSLADAKPYMTDDYYNSLNSEGFAGTSSPSRDRYEIISSQYSEDGKIYELKAKMYMKLNSEDAGYFDITLYVVNQDGTYLVNNVTYEEHTP